MSLPCVKHDEGPDPGCDPTARETCRDVSLLASLASVPLGDGFCPIATVQIALFGYCLTDLPTALNPQ